MAMRRYMLFSAGLILNVAFVSPILAAPTDMSGEIREKMVKIYSAIYQVFPLAIQEKDFSDSKNKVLIESNLKAISDQADTLKKHGQNKDAGFAFYSFSLAKDAQDAYRHYKRGRFNEAQYIVRNITENCIACHSRIPSKSDSNLAKGSFMERVEISKLPIEEKALLLVATRQFDTALDTYETMLLDRNFPKGQVVLLNPFLEYLTVAIRVKNEPERARKTLNAMLENQKLPSLVRQDMVNWTKSLSDLKTVTDTKKPILDQAKAYMDRAKRVMEFPLDRGGVVYYIQASTLLRQFLDENPKDKIKQGEAYYLLGMTELLAGRSYWLSQADVFFEASIRAAPEQAFAKKAYALLEENVMLEYSGSSGTHIPNEVDERLKELRKLLGIKSEVNPNQMN